MALVAGEEPLVSLDPFALARFDDVEADVRAHRIRGLPSQFPGGGTGRR